MLPCIEIRCIGIFEDLQGNFWMSAKEGTAVVRHVEHLVGVAYNAVRRELKVHGATGYLPKLWSYQSSCKDTKCCSDSEFIASYWKSGVCSVTSVYMKPSSVLLT